MGNVLSAGSAEEGGHPAEGEREGRAAVQREAGGRQAPQARDQEAQGGDCLPHQGHQKSGGSEKGGDVLDPTFTKF